jgi:hypothetical protein
MPIETGVQGVITVTDTASEAKVGSSVLGGRHSLLVRNRDASAPIYYGYDATVTDATGITIPAGGMMAWDFYPHRYVPVYLVAATGGSVSVEVEECA